MFFYLARLRERRYALAVAEWRSDRAELRLRRILSTLFESLETSRDVESRQRERTIRGVRSLLLSWQGKIQDIRASLKRKVQGLQAAVSAAAALEQRERARLTESTWERLRRAKSSFENALGQVLHRARSLVQRLSELQGEEAGQRSRAVAGAKLRLMEAKRRNEESRSRIASILEKLVQRTAADSLALLAARQARWDAEDAEALSALRLRFETGAVSYAGRFENSHLGRILISPVHQASKKKLEEDLAAWAKDELPSEESLEKIVRASTHRGQDIERSLHAALEGSILCLRTARVPGFEPLAAEGCETLPVERPASPTFKEVALPIVAVAGVAGVAGVLDMWIPKPNLSFVIGETLDAVKEAAMEEARTLLREELGEEASEELVESVAMLAIPGLGITLGAWKVFKYSKKAKAFFWDKKPLGKVRASVQEAVTEKGRTVVEDVGQRLATGRSEIVLRLRQEVERWKTDCLEALLAYRTAP